MRINLFLVALTVLLLPPAPAASAESQKFAVYYSDKAPTPQFKPYQLLILDSTHHPALRPLKEDGKTILGYLTLGEVSKDSDSYNALKSKNLILQENNNWKGSYYIDLRDPLWPKMVLEDLIPSVLRQGFDGIFLDTLDNPIELERSNPEKYRGMTEAAAHLVEAIRMHYPTIKIMMNRAYSLLPKIVPFIDMELGESVYADYDFNKKSYGMVEPATYHAQVGFLQAAKQRNPQLQIFTLDYANPKDHKTVVDIYQTERSNGFTPYVATIGLDQLVEEPELP